MTVTACLALAPEQDFSRQMRRALLSLCMMALPATSLQAAPPPPASEVKLVEFYTSEACASCLPADIAFTRIAAAADVIALSFHVAYWSYLGPDPFALAVADRRQWEYAHRRHSSEVFTPEMIVNGTVDGTGNTAGEIEAMLRQAKFLPRIVLSFGNGKVVADIPALPHSAGQSLWIATFDRSRDVRVKEGENAGHRIREVDIVRFAAPVAVLAETPKRIAVPLNSVQLHDGIATFVQEREGGPIIAAGRIYLHGAASGR